MVLFGQRWVNLPAAWFAWLGHVSRLNPGVSTNLSHVLPVENPGSRRTKFDLWLSALKKIPNWCLFGRGVLKRGYPPIIIHSNGFFFPYTRSILGVNSMTVETPWFHSRRIRHPNLSMRVPPGGQRNPPALGSEGEQTASKASRKRPRLGGFHSHGINPQMIGWFHGKSHLEMDDDWGYPNFRKPSKSRIYPGFIYS